MGMSATSLIVDTYKHGWTMLWLAMRTVYLVPSCCQYKFVLSFVILIYSNFTISFPTFMNGLSDVLLSCKVYGSDNNLT